MELKCDVCADVGKDVEAIGVANALGPMSSAFCRECLVSHRVTYNNLVGYLYAIGPIKTKDDIAEWVHPTIDATLAYYGKSWDDFVKDCAEAWEALDDSLKGEEGEDTLAHDDE